jgi:pyruvate dehydrogenase (quinone)/pyruvate oxidase
MAKKTASDVLIETLIAWGVDTVFGLPGDGINGVMESLRTRQDQVRFIQVRHEEAGALMACGYAKFTGKLGVCLATSGPGGIHLLNGLYDAKMDGVPVLAITGMQYHDLLDTFTQQDVELDKLFADVAVYNARVMSPAHMENVAELACRTALARRGVAHITIANDTQSEPLGEDYRSPRNIGNHVSNVPAMLAPKPPEAELRRAAGILNAGKKTAILAGRGAIGAAKELEAIADKLAAPVAKALLGKGALSDRSPFSTGGVGLLGTTPSQEALETCDTLLIVGSTFPYIEFYPKPDQARAVQIDIDPQRIGLRYPVECGLVGDAGAALAELLPLIEKRSDRVFLETAQQGVKDWREILAKHGSHQGTPMKPDVPVHQLNKLLPPNAIVTTDSGSNTGLTAQHIEITEGMLFGVSGTLATMACGLPYAIAAALAYPDRPVFAVVGDGGLSMLMAELATCTKYQLNIKVVVIKNNMLGQIKWEQMAFLGNPEFACDLQPIDFAAVARACGGEGFTIVEPGECAATLERALTSNGMAVIEATVDPNDPPLLPKIKYEHAKHMAEALSRGTEDGGDIAKKLLRNTIAELT